MTAAGNEPAGREPETLQIPPDLLPSEADAVRVALLERLRGGAPCDVELGDGAASPTALQLLVAARRMALRDDIPARIGARASAALAQIGTFEKIGD